jgi:hypothetical protein
MMAKMKTDASSKPQRKRDKRSVANRAQYGGRWDGPCHTGLRRRVHPLFCERRLSPHAQAVTPLIAFRGFLTLSLDRGRIFI